MRLRYINWPNDRSVLGSFLLFMFHVCLYHTVMSIHCSLVVTCRERANLLALFCVMFTCIFVTFPYGVLSQVINSGSLSFSLLSKDSFEFEPRHEISNNVVCATS